MSSTTIINDVEIQRENEIDFPIYIQKFGKITIDFSETSAEDFGKTKIFQSKTNYEGFVVRTAAGVDNERLNKLIANFIYRIGEETLKDYQKRNE